MEFRTLRLQMVVVIAIIQTVNGAGNGYVPVLKVDLAEADGATYKEYLYAIRRKDPCKNLGVCSSMWVSQAKINANEACRIALFIWDSLPPASKILCHMADSPGCRPTGRARCCPHIQRQECSFECTRGTLRTIKFLSDLVKLPEDSNPTAVKMYDLSEIISGF